MNPGHSRKLEQAVLQISRILNTLDDSITMLQEGTLQKILGYEKRKETRMKTRLVYAEMALMKER